MTTMRTDSTTTDVRAALLAEVADFHRRRQTHHRAMHDHCEGEARFEAAFDAYEGMVAAGCYAETLSTILRILLERHPQTAADVTALIHEVMENGNDSLEDANNDVWPLVEAAHAAKAAAEQAAPPAQFMIWSHEHTAWWKANRNGYTGALAEAGRYTEADARKICEGANWRWMQGYAQKHGDRPAEVMIPAFDLGAPGSWEDKAAAIWTAVSDATDAAIRARDEARAAAGR